MDTNEHELGEGGGEYVGRPLIHGDLVYAIVGCAMDVLNEVGHGYREKTYERGMLVAFQHQQIAYSSQARFLIYYRGVPIDEFIPDLVVDEKVIVDTKVVDKINDDHRGQILNYLRFCKLRVGLIINFAHPKLEWERIVL